MSTKLLIQKPENSHDPNLEQKQPVQATDMDDSTSDDLGSIFTLPTTPEQSMSPAEVEKDEDNDGAYDEAYEEACDRAYDEACDRAYEEACDRAYDEACDRAYEEACDRAYDEACDEAYHDAEIDADNDADDEADDELGGEGNIDETDEEGNDG